jgi:hypothetical protein
MAITHKYTLLCDEFRQENNGKFLIIGLYTPDIVVPIVPFALPNLTFFTVLESNEMADLGFNFRLTSAASGETVLAGGSGKMRVNAGMGVIPIRFGPLQLPSAGQYKFTIEIAESESITHEFRVVLSQQVGPVPTQRGGVH